jgi:diphthine synthase
MLYFIGLGLWDHKDITLRGAEALKTCSRGFLDMRVTPPPASIKCDLLRRYTSILGVDVPTLEKNFGLPITVADRDMVESGCDVILDAAADGNAAFLVVGDAFGATTHTDL